LHQVDERVWRSEQPTAWEFRKLEKLGIHRVLTLREFHSDAGLAKGLETRRVPMNAGSVDDGEVLSALKVIVKSDQPVLVHCWHGADRTGAVVAAYRMVVNGWPREQAIAEFMEPRFGHHAETFTNLRKYLERVDVERMRSELEKASATSLSPGP